MYGKDFIRRYESFTYVQLLTWSMRAILIWFVIVVLAGLLALGSLQIAISLFYAIVNLLNHQPIGDMPSFGLKCVAFSLIAIRLISLYPNVFNQLIWRRSLKLGIYLGILLLMAAGIDALVVHYYDTGIHCELPLPSTGY